MPNKFFSVFWSDVWRYRWIAVLALVWKLLEHWALAKADEYIGSYIGTAVKNVNAFLHVDLTIVVLVLVLIGILLHAAIEARQPSTTAQAKIFEIRFDYLPGNLLDNGWVRAYPKDANARPNTTVSSDAPIAGSINIEAEAGHAYNLSLPMNARLSDRLVFAAKYTATTMIFTDVDLSAKDGTQKTTKGIKYLLGKGAPHPTKDWENDEWTVYIPGEPLKNGWRRFDISLPEDVSQTWGTRGLIFRGIAKFRIRGSLGISPIEFYESR
jgi:hypothetical protein